MSIVFYLSQHVNTPLPHQDTRTITATRKQDGTEYDRGTATVRSLSHILQSKDQPDVGFLAISYPGGRLYLADNDFASKPTFASGATFPIAELRRHVDRTGIDRTVALISLFPSFYMCAA